MPKVHFNKVNHYELFMNFSKTPNKGSSYIHSYMNKESKFNNRLCAFGREE